MNKEGFAQNWSCAAIAKSLRKRNAVKPGPNPIEYLAQKMLYKTGAEQGFLVDVFCIIRLV